MNRRRAFTLVEMLVAMTLVIFIMVILSEAFVVALETFRQLKAIGDMEERLRGVTTILRQDLASEHFDGRRRLSDPDFWIQGPPREGFFRIWQESPPVPEGLNGLGDGDGLYSFRATNHALHYTVRKRGNRREDFFVGAVLAHNPVLPGEYALNGQTNFFGGDQPAVSRFQDPGTYTSQWKEVAVFLRPNGSSTAGPGGPVPLFGLYRRSLLAVPDNRHVNWEVYADPPGPNASIGDNTPVPVTDINAFGAYLASVQATFSDISCKKRGFNYSGPVAYPDTLYFNNPTDLTQPPRRFGMAQADLPYQIPGLFLPGAYSLAGWPIRGAITGGPPKGADLRYPVYGDLEQNGQNPRLPLLTQDPSLQGADLLIDDVISFDVSVLVGSTPNGATPSFIIPDFINLFDYDPVNNLDPTRPVRDRLAAVRTNTSFYRPRGVQTTAVNPAVFDTWSWQRNDIYDYSNWDPDLAGGAGVSTASVPLKIRILAIRITLRVWDQKSQQARQITLTQDM
jgi:type II secretory pathway component PulJ